MAVPGAAAAHRPGALKQQNKPHKGGRHGGGAQRRAPGRVPAPALSRRRRRDLRRQDRRHQALQLRRRRREAVLAEKRLLGGADGPPHLVAVVPLHEGARGPDALRLLRSDAANLVVSEADGARGFTLLCPRLRQRWRFVLAPTRDFHAVLDLAKVADSLLFVLHPEDGWDSAGENCLSCLFAQGLPSCALAVQGMADLPPKKQTEAKKKLSKAIEKRFPEAKLFPLNTEQESLLLLRHLAAQKQRHLAFRDRRAYLLAHAAEFVPSQESDLVGTLKVSGFIRGQPLNVNSLVHIVGQGDFQMSQVDAPPDPLCLNPRAAKRPERKGQDMEIQDEPGNSAVQMEEDVKVLMKADPSRQELLQSEVVPDPMEGEQTWPTEEELKEAEEAVKERRKTVKVPKGTSKYQAAWIVDDEEDGSEEDEDGDSMEEDDLMEEEAFQDGESSEEEEEPVEDECETMTLPESARDDQYDERVEEDEQVLEKYRQERTDEMFPDEVDTPRDMPARVRFQKYRGLKSFRTSPWDPKENLPRDYARIFQFQDFSRTRKHVFRQLEKEETDGAAVGWYVTLHISSVPVSLMESFRQGKPLVLFSLLPHEQKMSVLHFLVRRHPGNVEPVKAKEELIFHCGFRRFRASALYSQHTSADKHKAERFLRPDAALVVTVYAPITFPPALVLLFKQRSNEDVLWFKPVELRTKWGRRGHIEEPLGTHGHMKCHFDGQLKSQDTVLMNLYKRVFPKWTYDPYVPEPVAWVRNEEPAPVPEVDME
ncbi:pre-rRNA-processing protein TSR1 homolog isoform X2 [Alligator mississippiensis]|uniref:pre-rRNA-processing protein TSR1 homolog isoform X2 n=1 Tax=Alligator mississippiensis TaxID=8496 RepID=UPI0028778DC1|nr:pre-rRNA-processing protein TSR1 homolog isoform X2 [Alligator mississippiensis]